MLIDLKKIHKSFPATMVLMVMLYISAYCVKLGEMFFWGYPFSLFIFTAQDLLNYSLKPFILILILFLFYFYLNLLNKQLNYKAAQIITFFLLSIAPIKLLLGLDRYIPLEINILFSVTNILLATMIIINFIEFLIKRGIERNNTSKLMSFF